MMEDLIKAYEDRGVKFWVENGQLKFKAPSGTLNAEDKLQGRIKFWKSPEQNI